MTRFALAVASAAALALPTVPALAQDYTGNVNPGAWSSSMPMEASIRAQARSQSRSNRAYRNDDRSAAQTCRELPSYARQLGNDNWRVKKLRSMCREAGYR